MSELVGWIGAAFVLGAYVGFSAHKLDRRTFHGLTFAGASLVALNAISHEAWAVFALQISFAIVAALSFLREDKSNG